MDGLRLGPVRCRRNDTLRNNGTGLWPGFALRAGRRLTPPGSRYGSDRSQPKVAATRSRVGAFDAGEVLENIHWSG